MSRCTCANTATQFAFDDPTAALAALLEPLRVPGIESVPLHQAAGRVLAEPVASDRPSPACDVSAMDGYALRLDELMQNNRLPVHGEASIGRRPPKLEPGHAMRIFTGGPVPAEADAVVRREDVDESAEAIVLRVPIERVRRGANIRHRGENAASGITVADVGRTITTAQAAALATFGYANVRVHRPVRVAVLVTGDEVLAVTDDPSPWQLRDANGPALAALLSPAPWVELMRPRHVRDDRGRLAAALAEALEAADAVLLTGGVSMGDHDHVPAVVADVGCTGVFHRLPIRPGKPVLGAVGPAGQLVMGLPGNPVSVMATARRLAVPGLRRCAGFARTGDRPAPVHVADADDCVLKMHWSRPARWAGQNVVELIATRGSGDIAAVASSDGFVEIPPGASGRGPWPFYTWSIGS